MWQGRSRQTTATSIIVDFVHTHFIFHEQPASASHGFFTEKFSGKFFADDVNKFRYVSADIPKL